MNRSIVVGAGLSGAACALALADADREVVLIEATTRMGGRVHSVTDPQTGLMLDNCQHVAFRAYTNFLQLLGRIDARGALRLQPRTVLPFLEVATGRQAIVRSGRLSAPNHLVGSLLRFPFIGGGEKLALRHPTKRIMQVARDQLPELDEMDFATWLAGLGQSERVVRRFWGPIVAAALNVDIHQASAAQCIVLFQEAIFKAADRFDVGAFTADLGAALGEPLRAGLEAGGVSVRERSRVSGLSIGETASVHIGDEVIEAEHIVLATPHQTTAKLLRTADAAPTVWGETADRLEALGQAALIALHALYAGERVPADFTFAALIDEPIIQMLFNRDVELATPLEHEGEHLQWLSVPVSAADAHLGLSDADLEAEFDRVIDQVWTDRRHVERRRFIVVRTKRATWAAVPGTRRSRVTPDVLGDPRVLIAGDHLAHDWPATMEAAVRGGLWAAATVLGTPDWAPGAAWTPWPAPPQRGDATWPVW